MTSSAAAKYISDSQAVGCCTPALLTALPSEPTRKLVLPSLHRGLLLSFRRSTSTGPSPALADFTFRCCIIISIMKLMTTGVTGGWASTGI